jgi:transposase
LNDLSRAFAALYRDFGRPSIAPEKLLRAMLLQAFYGIRSERQLMERLVGTTTITMVRATCRDGSKNGMVSVRHRSAHSRRRQSRPPGSAGRL